jgi:ubiquinone/menaquinone biosynthesis C-methylase UbiE
MVIFFLYLYYNEFLLCRAKIRIKVNDLSFFSKILTKVYLWATEKLYHSFAWAYDYVAWLVSFGYWSRWRLDVLNYISEGPILEIGFGTGDLLIEMKNRGLQIVGLELSRQMHRVAQRKIQKRKLDISRVQGAAATMPFAGGSFCNVISTFPSNYIFQKTVLTEVYRVLFSGGRVVITGLKVKFKSPVFHWLTKWFLDQDISTYIKNLFSEAEELGFRGEIIEHDGEAYRLPLLILEK